MFNEKLMAGLGRGLRETGRLEEDAMAAGERALARFAGLARSIGVSRLRAVATAAVRQASNGPDFVDRVQRTTGLRIAVLSGDAEAAASARSEEHTSELQSLMRISYAVFCLQK